MTGRRFCVTRTAGRAKPGFIPAHEPGPDHPNAPGPGTVTCWWCNGDGCRSCAGSGLLPDDIPDADT
ncbi:hypothetical protein [Acrocarpospora catenulata]|uniref:hypothetical protein n=1 Tax=Acrocarpospora catenulata TaxID=2836182 RepID=UPI001BD9DFCF|nr:hypothetical protein [Acrocarpospora catenulata]